MLMGCSTYGIVEKFGQWHYGETPVLVATHRPLEPMADTIQTAAGARSSSEGPGLGGERTCASTAATSFARP